jgi:hypothetical protein
MKKPKLHFIKMYKHISINQFTDRELDDYKRYKDKISSEILCMYVLMLSIVAITLLFNLVILPIFFFSFGTAIFICNLRCQYLLNHKLIVRENLFNNLLVKCKSKLNFLASSLNAYKMVNEYYANIINRLNNQINNAKTVNELKDIYDTILDYIDIMNYDRMEQEFKNFFGGNGEYKYNANTNEPKYTNNSLAKYLKILNLDSNITDFDIIKSQWKKLMVKYHPDRYNDGGEKAKQINSAFDEIKNIFGKK